MSFFTTNTTTLLRGTTATHLLTFVPSGGGVLPPSVAGHPARRQCPQLSSPAGLRSRHARERLPTPRTVVQSGPAVLLRASAVGVVVAAVSVRASVRPHAVPLFDEVVIDTGETFGIDRKHSRVSPRRRTETAATAKDRGTSIREATVLVGPIDQLPSEWQLFHQDTVLVRLVVGDRSNSGTSVRNRSRRVSEPFRGRIRVPKSGMPISSNTRSTWGWRESPRNVRSGYPGLAPTTTTSISEPPQCARWNRSRLGTHFRDYGWVVMRTDEGRTSQ